MISRSMSFSDKITTDGTDSGGVLGHMFGSFNTEGNDFQMSFSLVRNPMDSEIEIIRKQIADFKAVLATEASAVGLTYFGN